MITNIIDLLSRNTYPGRGIIIGQSADARYAVIAYFIMGRSDNSRNRIFLENGDDLRIEPYDAAKCSDPSLIIYAPLRVNGVQTIITNGNQTDTIFDHLTSGSDFASALRTREYEPDAPNYTPRISGMVCRKPKFGYTLSILRRSDPDKAACERMFFEYEPMPGVGHFISTYQHDGNPLPSFTGDPLPITIAGDIDSFANNLWDALNADNKVSLAVRYIDLAGNDYQQKLFNKNK